MIKDIIDKNENVKPNENKISKLKELLPNCFDKKGNLDIELLKKELNQDVDLTRESYELNFLGKTYAKMITGLDTETVIEPDTEHNIQNENKNSENIYISGDNLDALKHLLKGYEGKIKCIYIDPPYNTGSDGFAYNDSFNFNKFQLEEKLDIGEDEAERIIDITSGNSSSHSAWLTFIYPRLYLARQLLKDDGIIFISIDDNEQSQLKVLCDDIFGAENFCAVIPWRKRTAKSDVPFGMSQDYEWILCYAKGNKAKVNTEGKGRKYYETPDFPGRPWRTHDMTCQQTASARPNSYFTMVNPRNGKEYPADPNRVWRITKETFNKYYEANEIVFPGDYDFLKISKPVARYFKDKDMAKDGENFGKVTVSTKLPENIGMSQDGTKEIKELFDFIPFPFPKPTNLIKFLISICTQDEDIVLDFFSGSATTAQSVMQLNAEKDYNLKYILVQLKENTKENSEAYNNGFKTIDEIGQERIKRAAKKIKKETNADIDYGFKHYSLKETNKSLLSKLEQFEPQLINETYDLYKEYGIDTIVETWKLRDGYKFTMPVEIINCNGYNAYKCEDSLYLIEPNIDIKNIKALLEHYSSDDLFVCNKIVLFGYSFKFNELEMIKNNIKQVKNFKNIDVKVYIRY